MRFEVLDRDGVVKMSTEHKKCIYPLATLKSMEAVGYKFQVNGKRWRSGQEIPAESLKTKQRKPRPD